MKWTVLVMNGALATNRYCGTFDREESAQQWARGEASRSRRFVCYYVCRGTAQNPGKLVGPEVRGILP